MCVRNADDHCVLQFTLILAAGCVLHRRTSRVIHRRELFRLRPTWVGRPTAPLSRPGQGARREGGPPARVLKEMALSITEVMTAPVAGGAEDPQPRPEPGRAGTGSPLSLFGGPCLCGRTRSAARPVPPAHLRPSPGVPGPRLPSDRTPSPGPRARRLPLVGHWRGRPGGGRPRGSGVGHSSLHTEDSTVAGSRRPTRAAGEPAGDNLDRFLVR